MPHREFYQIGSMRFSDRAHAILISPQSVYELAVAVTTQIPAHVFNAQADLEAGFAVNEVDEGDSAGTTYGTYQLSDTEYASVPGYTPIRFDPWNDTRVLALLHSRHADDIHTWSKGRLSCDDDLWAYLGWYHNQGPGAVKKSIETYGCDYKLWIARNEAEAIAMPPGDKKDTFTDFVARSKRYAEYCVTGGPRWKEVVTR